VFEKIGEMRYLVIARENQSYFPLPENVLNNE
jgi:hypothetical protein